MNLFDLTGQVALVTGSTRGIGLAIARALQSHGAQVVISSEDAADCARVANDHGTVGIAFQYLYDFGDAWEHSVKIERVSAASPHLTYPLILDAVGMRPPEDCGGPWGYAEKLEALADPQHEYHEEALETLGEDHDPNAKPDIPLIDARLEALAKKWAPRTLRKA
ncbi:plasmid pRiA4b ORF-3 family protein [Sphingobium sp.]|uniref:plasmid pRiA4b ORF-3 family protein n=1 Tax=Sphingobium sp. TaxID=1912891 RepID=UPI002C7D5E40|nr:SDR family NAD(P)-dependent oxidoreductase [Sphingobium sp.]HUD93598.1 SDR family NAD(P)-dependent oxidoreductase [Sphingobium sp.]